MPTYTRLASLIWFSVLLIAGPAAGQQLVGDLTVDWTPQRPAQGSLFRVTVTTPPESNVIGVAGTIGGEPLHLRPVDAGRRESLAAVPLDVGDSIALPLVVLRWTGAVDTLRVHIPVSPGEYRMERLTVAPRFGDPPDSATAARTAAEFARAMQVSDGAHGTPSMWDSIVQPRESRITSGFGHGREFNGQVQSRHTGTDFAGAEGSPVRVAADGVVALVDEFFLAGNVIYIDHGAGLVTGYFHLSRQDVAQGDTVQAGQVIGQVGATGRVTGPHLHWIVRYGRISVDPMSLLSIRR